MQILATPTRPHTTAKTTLDGQDFVLTWEWNMRLGWLLGLADQDGSTIFSPRRLVPNWDLLYVCTDPRRPRGMLLCIDSVADAEPPTYESLGLRHQLVYVTEAEVKELRDG